MTEPQFIALAARASDTALGAARSICSTTEDAEDVAQDVMLRLWTMREQLGGEADMLRLAYVAARNMSIDLCRRKGRAVGLDEKVDAILRDAAPSPSDTLIYKEALDWTLRRMQQLPPSEYQMLRMRQVEDKNNREIAEILHVKPETVANMLARARQKLLADVRRGAYADLLNTKNRKR